MDHFESGQGAFTNPVVGTTLSESGPLGPGLWSVTIVGSANAATQISLFHQDASSNFLLAMPLYIAAGVPFFGTVLFNVGLNDKLILRQGENLTGKSAASMIGIKVR